MNPLCSNRELVRLAFLFLLCAWASVMKASAATPELLTSRNASLTPPTVGNGNSTAPWISDDGRFVVFSSSANNLVTNDNGQFGLDVFLRDRSSNTTRLVSANLNGVGGDGSSTFGQGSTNGRYIVFESVAKDLVANDTNSVSDLFVRDLLTETTMLVSVATDGVVGDGASSDAAMTPDGRYVVFVSAATNLVAGDTNGIPDVFVRDLVTGVTVRASAGATGSTAAFMASPRISPDGRFVVFASNARGMSPGIPANPVGEVYLRDLLAGTTQWASTNASVLASNVLHLNNSPSYHPALSDDGGFVAFKVGWTNGLVAPGGSGVAATLILRFDTAARSTTTVSTNSFAPWIQNDDVFGPVMTPDGRFVAYGEKEILSNTTNSSVRLWDAQTGTNVLISGDPNGLVVANSLSHSHAISSGGRFVAFISNATNLVSNAISNGYHVYLRDTQTATTSLVDVDTNNIGSTDIEGTLPVLSADGRYVAFASGDGSLVTKDNNDALDVFVRDTVGNSTELISQRALPVGSQSANGISALWQYSISADGRWVAFSSHADDLVPNDTNRAPDIFVHDRVSATNTLVSAGTNGLPAKGGFSANPIISGNGRFVAFLSTATNLMAGPANRLSLNLFRRDLQTGTTAMVSVATNGVSPGDGDASFPSISHDGRYIAFLSRARNIAAGVFGVGPNTFWRDMDSGITVSLLGNSDTVIPPSMSSDGRYVVYFNASSQVRVRDMQSSINLYTNLGAVTFAAVSPDGARLLYRIGNAVSVLNLGANSNVFSLTMPTRSVGPWSTNGRFFAFVTTSNAVPADINGTNDVYLCDLQNGGARTLVSWNSSLTASANGPSDTPALSGDGRFVVYRSFATNIVPGISNTPNIFLFDRAWGTNALLTIASGTSGWTPWSARPMISASGGAVVFQSWNSSLVARDLNRMSDIFVAVVVPATDSDGDGIPDSWTMEYFGHPTGQAGDQSRAQDDADGDGMTNLQEYIAGTIPTSAASAFRAAISLVVASNNVVLSWLAAAGRTYQVQYKDDLGDAVWHDAAGGVSIVGNTAYFTAPSDAPPKRFYRIRAGN